MVCDVEARRAGLHEFEAVQERTTEKLPAHVVVLDWEEASTGVEQPFEVGVEKTGAVGHAIVLMAGRDPMEGIVVSSTVMVWEVVAVLPQASVAVQVRTTAPHPLGVDVARLRDVIAPQASLAVACAKLGVDGQSTVEATGSAANDGPVVSCTTIVWDVVALCLGLQLSRTVQ
jgi:hypothetical protein